MEDIDSIRRGTYVTLSSGIQESGVNQLGWYLGVVSTCFTFQVILSGWIWHKHTEPQPVSGFVF